MVATENFLLGFIELQDMRDSFPSPLSVSHFIIIII